jgi:hypothetical protein
MAMIKLFFSAGGKLRVMFSELQSSASNEKTSKIGILRRLL